MFFIAGTVTLLSAAILAAVALWRSRIVPRWLAAGEYGVAWVTGLFFTGDPGAGAGLAVLPLLAGQHPDRPCPGARGRGGTGGTAGRLRPAHPAAA